MQADEVREKTVEEIVEEKMSLVRLHAQQDPKLAAQIVRDWVTANG